MRAFLSDAAGNEPFFHLLRSAGFTRAVRARAASEHRHTLVYASRAAILCTAVEKSLPLSAGVAGGLLSLPGLHTACGSGCFMGDCATGLPPGGSSSSFASHSAASARNSASQSRQLLSRQTQYCPSRSGK